MRAEAVWLAGQSYLFGRWYRLYKCRSSFNILFSRKKNKIKINFTLFITTYSRLYAVGGRDGSSCLKSVEYYDPHTNKWTSCCPMIRRRCSVGVGVLNGYLYAVGGYDAPATNPSASRFSCVERYV